MDLARAFAFVEWVKGSGDSRMPRREHFVKAARMLGPHPKESSKEMRRRLNSSGRCRCGRPLARGSRYKCAKCIVQERETQQAREQARRDAGLCIYCCARTDGRHVICLPCRVKYRKFNAARRARAKARAKK